MKRQPPYCCFAALLLLVLVLSSFRAENKSAADPAGRFPYQKAGLTEREAAAHLLSRFTFGARPGQVDQVVKMGLEQWFRRQLAADLPDPALQQRLAGYQTLTMTNEQILNTFPKPAAVLRQAVREGAIDRAAVSKDAADKRARREYRDKLAAYMRQKGYRPQAELFRELINQKILRAAYSENQLQEVLTSFWFNHFNVSLTDNDCARFVLAYERDVIRPHVLGPFETLLLATAKSPAMLTYLDNFKSTAAGQGALPGRRQPVQQGPARDSMQQAQPVVARRQKAQGLNENYAREIMELHTLGVDGGYTQHDVTQAARILTGWTLYPLGDAAAAARKKMAGLRQEHLQRQGVVREGDFLFAASKHDRGAKTVLGTPFPAGGGYEEGRQLIALLARHPATARFIATKLAVRFVHDIPPASLVDKMARTFRDQQGDIRLVLLTMVTAPEFWSPAARREKTKSPFELALSAARSLDADIRAPYPLFTWISRMGERLYYYQAPTGFPDKGQYWINTGALLNRMNFGLALAAQRIPGIRFDLAALNHHREPESAEAALLTYSRLLLPGRDLEETIRRLSPTLHDPAFGRKVDAASKTNSSEAPVADERLPGTPAQGKPRQKKPGNAKPGGQEETDGSNVQLAQVVGIIIGSPEFQRR